MNQHTPYRQWMRRAMEKAIEHNGAQPLLSLEEARTVLALTEKPTTPMIGSLRNPTTANRRTLTKRAGEGKP